jgi:hypothetical protein
VGVLRLSGWTWNQSNPAMDEYVAAQSAGEDRHQASIHEGQNGLATAVGQFPQWLVRIGRTPDWFVRKRLSSIRILRTGQTRIHNRAGCCGKGEAPNQDIGGR